jgi:hypothetical protein
VGGVDGKVTPLVVLVVVAGVGEGECAHGLDQCGTAHINIPLILTSTLLDDSGVMSRRCQLLETGVQHSHRPHPQPAHSPGPAPPPRRA